MDQTLSEQERVFVVAQALSAYKFVTGNPDRTRLWRSKQVKVTSSEVAGIAGLSVEVVEAAITNIGERLAA